MKKAIFTMLCFIALIQTGFSQTIAQIGTGTDVPANTLYAPIYRFSNSTTSDYSRANIVYTAAELAAAGITDGSVITDISFYKVDTFSTVAPAVFSVWMNNSSVTPPLATTTTWASISSTFTQVYNNTAQTITGSGWAKFTLNNPFTYTGGSLEIAFDWNCSAISGNPTTGKFDWQYTSGYADYIVGAGTTTAPATLNGTTAVYKHRPNIRIGFSAPAGTDAGLGIIAGAICPGVNSVAVTLSSNASNPLNSVTVAWSVNGVAQTPYTWTGTLASPNNVDITLGTYNFIAGNSYTIEAYISDVNTTGADINQNNDTISFTQQTGLSGNFTINSASATAGNNYQSFTDWASALAARGVCGPVVVDVVSGSGPYNEQVIIPQIQGTSAINTVTVNGHGETVSFNSTATAERAAIKLNGADHFTFDSLHVSANGTYGFGFHLLNDADSNTISNCAVDINITSTSTNFAGIAISGSATSAVGTGGTNCDYNTISGNVINGGYYGITLVANSSSNMIYGNRVLNNYVNDFYSFGIYLNGNDGAIVEGNDISRPLRANTTTFYGIYLININYNTLVSKNKIHNTFDGIPTSTSGAYGIEHYDCDATLGSENVVVNNLIYNMNSSGTQNAFLNRSSDYVLYYHNTASLDDQTTTCASCATRGYYLQDDSVKGQEFINNLITITRTNGGASEGIYFSVTGSNFVSDYNNIYVAGANSSNSFGYFNGALRATLADWQAATLQDSNTLAVDPLYTSPVNGNYTPSSPAVNDSGTYVGVTEDIAGAPRNNTTPDIGAYEFDISGDDAGITAFATTSCAGTDSVIVTVQNFGATTLNTVTVYALINGIPAPNSGTVFTVNLASGTSTTLNMGNVTFNSGASYNILAYTGMPNGFSDGNNANDTLNQPINLQLSGNYTVNSALVTGGNNFQTLTDMADALNTYGICGPVVVDVVPGSGPYVNQQVVLNQIAGSSAVNTITLNGHGEWLTFASSTSANRSGIKLVGTDYVTIDSFVVEATGTYGFGIHLMSQADNNIIRNNTVYTDTASSSTNYSGIVISNSATSATSTGNAGNHNLIENNTVRGGENGIAIVGNSSTVHVQNNRIINNTITHFYEYGIYSYYQDSVVISGNYIEQRDTGATTAYGMSVYYNDYSTVTQNHVVTKGATTNYGIYLYYNDASAAKPNDVSNNFVSVLRGSGSVYGIYPFNNYYTNVYHNTVNVLGGSATAGRAIYINSSTSGAYGFVNVKNNIAVNTGLGYAVEVSSAAVTLGYVSSMDYNDWYGTGAVLGRYNNINHATLTSWKAGVPFDSNSVSINPIFTGATDLHIASNLLNDRGTSGLGITDDIDGDVRCPNPGCAGSTLRPDIGADEFFGTPITIDMGVTALVSPVQQSCYTNNETVSVTIKNFSSETIDFSVNPVTVYAVATDSTITNFTPVVISSDTLAPDSTLTVTVSTGYDMSYPGTYTFKVFTSEASDGNPLNDTLQNVSVEFNIGSVDQSYAQVCMGSPYQLRVNGITGTVQWQSYDVANSVWVNETGSGSDSVVYAVTPVTTTIYRVLVCGTFASTSDTLEPVMPTPPVTTNDTICGPGAATVTGSGNGTISWYTAATGGTLVDTGDTLTVTVQGDTTLYAENSTNLIGNGGSLKISEIDVGTTDAIEIENLSGQAINTTGWVVAISNNYSNINAVNPILWNLPATMAPGQILVRDDGGGVNDWGNNILWNPANGSTRGWAMIVDNLGNVVDFAVWDNWPAGALSTFQPVVNGFTINLGTQWSGNYYSTTGIGTQTITREGSIDNNDSSDFAFRPGTIGTHNPGLSTVLNGGSCPSTRVATHVSVLPVPAVNLGNDVTQCEGTLTLDAQNPGDSYLWNTGATTQSVLVDTTGTYAVTVTSANGCTDNDAVNITIASYPVVNLGADTSLCGGSIILATSNAGNTFLWSNGSSLPFLTVTNSGTYSVTVTTPQQCTKSDTVVVAINTAPTVSLGADTTQCGGSILLDAGTANAANTITWNTGANGQTISATQTGTYSVVVTTPQNCSATDSVNVTINALPAVNLGADTTQCGGDISLDAENAGATYAWSTLETTQKIMVDTTGSYSVVVTSSAGCTATDAINITINSIPTVTFSLPADTLCSNAPAISLSATPNGGTFSGTGVSGNSFNPATAGLGTKTVTYNYTDNNGCSASASDNLLVVVCTGLEETTETGFSIYPNPSSGIVYVDLSAFKNTAVSVDVYNAEGRLVSRASIMVNEPVHTLNLREYAQGVYVVKVVTEGSAFTRRLVIE